MRREPTSTIAFWGDDFGEACIYSNFGDRNSGYQAGMVAPCSEEISPLWTAEVGSYAPNPWGLYDMAGNAQELVEDCWHESYDGAPVDGSAWSEPDCNLFVTRGGDYELLYISMRASERLFYGYVEEESAVEVPNAGEDGRSNVLGFRVAASL
jgi:formylglycine-generating enzyme required for sulfatase activity